MAEGQVSFKQRLAALKRGNSWEEALKKSKESAFTELPDGRYLTKLTEVKIGDSRNGRFQMTFVFVVTEGDQSGESIYMFHALDNPDRIEWLFRDLAKFGIPDSMYADPTKLEELCTYLVEQAYEVRVVLKTTTSKKDGQQYQNANIDKVLATANGALADTPGTDNPLLGKEVPFVVGNKSMTGTVTAVNGSEITINSGNRTYIVGPDDISDI